MYLPAEWIAERRAQFEACYIINNLAGVLARRDEHGEYISSIIEHAWRGWLFAAIYYTAPKDERDESR